MAAVLKALERYIGVLDIAAALGVSVHTVRGWRKTGKLPPAIKFGKLIRWELHSIANWLAEHKGPAQQRPNQPTNKETPVPNPTGRNQYSARNHTQAASTPTQAPQPAGSVPVVTGYASAPQTVNIPATVHGANHPPSTEHER